MNYSAIKVIKEVGYKDVNTLLKEGWVLLGVFQFAEIDSNSYGSFQMADVIYVIGNIQMSEQAARDES